MNICRTLHSTIGEFGRSKPSGGIFALAASTFVRAQPQYISAMLSFAHKSGKPCGNECKFPTNLPHFNAMMRFALFLCNLPAPNGFFANLYSVNSRQLASYQPNRKTYTVCSRLCHCPALLIPFRRTLQMNLDHLLWFGDVIPMPVRFPSIRHNLNQHSSQRRIRHVRYSVLIRFHIHFKFLILN